ncbi:MAG: hypothetical protein JXA42_00600 [Anaerolineales bacterium]|nr:hypothetical protein [Anaerolineales bacterium]
MNIHDQKTENELIAFEIDCIRKAAERPQAKVKRLMCQGGVRSRTYVIDEPACFVKCMDSGIQNSDLFITSLDHEAEGFKFFTPFNNGMMGLPEVHFFQTFSQDENRELQVLGVTNLEKIGKLVAPRDIYLNSKATLAKKVTVAELCARSLSRLTSTELQTNLDISAGIASIQRRMNRFLEHPKWDRMLTKPENHALFPWAYQNYTIGEVNIMIPLWLEMAGRGVDTETQIKIEKIKRIFADPDMIDSFSPGKSADRIILSPGDRQDGNSILVMNDQGIVKIFEVDLESWGLETTGRMIGRYAAIHCAAVRDDWPRWEMTACGANEILQHEYPCLTGALFYHFIRGDGENQIDLISRALSLAMGGIHAAVFWLYAAALIPQCALVFIGDSLAYLETPERFLKLAADYAETRPDHEAEPVLEAVGQVWIAFQPIKKLIDDLLI